MPQEDRFAIIRYIVDMLKDVGKVRMQKLVYFLQWIFTVPLGYDYKMHYYGPYSDELNDDLIAMQADDTAKIGAEIVCSSNIFEYNSGQIDIEKFRDYVEHLSRQIGIDILMEYEHVGDRL